MARTRRMSESLELTRRDLLRLSSASLIGASAFPWLEAAAHATPAPARKRACILLWMNGGPSQMDTFDLKPGHENGGSFKEIATSVPGIKISEHLPKIAGMAEHMAIIRSMSTKEGDHSRATYLLRIGYLPQPPLRYPTLGSLVAKELGDPMAELPNFVSVAPYRALNPAAFGPGFLGSQYAPLFVGEAQPGGDDEDMSGGNYGLAVADLAPGEGIKAETVSAGWVF